MGELLRRGLDLGQSGRMRLPRRASTLPGPTSTKRRPPASCMASTVSRQRTGRVRASVELGADVRERLRASREEKTGKRGLVQLDLVERGAERRDGRLHARRVERAGDVERQRAAAVLAGGLLGLRELVARAGEDDLAGGVVVGDGDAGGLGDRARSPPRSRRRARASSRRVVGLGHQLAAQHDEAQRVVALEHAGGGERGQLAERVAGGGARRRGRARPSRRGWRRRWRAGRSGWTRSARGNGILAHERDAALEQVRGALARRGRASRVSGCPGRGKARPGQRGR